MKRSEIRGRRWTLSRIALRSIRATSREKLPQQLRGYVRILLRQKMSAIHRRAAHIGRPFLPRIEWRRRRARNTGITPQRQHRDGDLLAGIGIYLVDFVVGIAAGAVILAPPVHEGGVDALRERR